MKNLLEQVRKVLLLPSWSQWLKWSLPSKQTTVSTVVGVVGLGLTVYALLPSPPPAPPVKAYDLAESRRASFLELLRIGQSSPRDRIRVGCIPWSEASCIAAGNFLTLLSEAGWEIDGDSVFKVEPSVPVDGMTITSRGDDIANLPKLPPHLGRWSYMDRSQELISMAFRYMDNPVHSSSDPTLPPGTLGIYFGPEPALAQSLKPRDKAAVKELIGYLGAGLDIEQNCVQSQPSECVATLAPWDSAVSEYFQEHGLSDVAVNNWNKLPRNPPEVTRESIERRINLLTSVILMAEQAGGLNVH